MTEKTSAKVSETNSDEIDLGRLLGTLLDNRWLIIGVTAVFTVLGIMYAMLATPVYKADALVQVEQNSGNSLLNDISSMLPDAKPQSAAEIELIKSRMVIGKTVNDLALDISVQQKYFPLVGKGIARLAGSEPGKIAVSRLDVPTSWQDETLSLEVLPNQQYTVEAGDTVKFTGSIGQLESHNGITLLVSDIVAEPGTIFRIQKLNQLTAINLLLDNFIVADKGKDTGVLALSLEGEDQFLLLRY